MTKITFLGTGNAFVPPIVLPNGGIDCAWQSNLLLETPGGKKILLDCGGDIRFSLTEQGLGPADIDGVYISHVHADHIGGLEWLAFNTFFSPGTQKPTLWVAEEILDDLRHSTEPGLSPINGMKMTLDNFFEVVIFCEEEVFELEDDLLVETVRTVHVPGDVEKVSFGLFFPGAKSLFWTSDSTFDAEMVSEYLAADIILQDCELGFASGVHAHFDQLCTLPNDIQAKMWLYHHNPALVDQHRDAGASFAGFATKGQSFNF